MKQPTLISPLVKSLAEMAEKSKYGYVNTRHMNKMIRYAESRGLKQLGSGAYSVVFAHETDRKKVVKITLSAVDGYHKFVKWVLANRPLMKPLQRRHLPRIYETIEYKGARITVLEKLSPGEDAYLDENVNQIVRSMGELFNLLDDSGGRNTMARGNCAVITDPWSHNHH